MKGLKLTTPSFPNARLIGHGCCATATDTPSTSARAAAEDDNSSRRMTFTQLRNTIAPILDDCIAAGDVAEGTRILQFLRRSASRPDVFLLNKVLILYSTSALTDEARRLLQSMRHANAVSWATVIAGYARHGSPETALQLFRQMQLCSGIMPNRFVMPGALRACAALGAASQGAQLHACAVKSGFTADVAFSNSLTDMYVKLGSLPCARRVFVDMPVRNVVSWTTLLDGTARLGKLQEARRLFDEMPERNLVSWTAMMCAHVQGDEPQEAWRLFAALRRTEEAVSPDDAACASALRACAATCNLAAGRAVHALAVAVGLDGLCVVATALLDMYSKCGSDEAAAAAFETVAPRGRDVVAWNAILAVHARHGRAAQALRVFEDMRRGSSGVRPNRVTFTHVLHACAAAGGLLTEGLAAFRAMREEYGMAAEEEQYACLVELLGRAGRLKEAMNVAVEAEAEAEFEGESGGAASVWCALLAACGRHRNVEMASAAAQRLMQLRPHDASVYVTLSNIYSAAGRPVDAARLRSFVAREHGTHTPTPPEEEQEEEEWCAGFTQGT